MNRPGLAARWAGRLLCWTLAAAMASAAVEAVVKPGAGWWRTAWPLPWYLVPVWALLWAALRAREKRTTGAGRPGADENVPTDYDEIA
ncbi:MULTISPECIES: hypothetical protein [Streptomyces]|jgi:hypothetical protein|uniref:hypothetical protein n=1 Tax=Streptomyces TaxID=1883 RepID=UPI00090C5EE3|nr:MULTISPECIES: hypothetical protein [unclassified Streptomyces]MDX2677087.1 hypothetical protein [Streptomyces sp. NY05-11A]SHI25431.1 hypothetical protein SAMN05444521_6240 [Streptomyces sp. 3214.6]